MKTTHPALREARSARLRDEAEDGKWTQLKRECQSPAILAVTWVGILLFLAVIGGLWLRSHPGDWNGFPMLPFATVLGFAPGVFFLFQKRHRSLLKIIETEAPQLFQKLKDEDIA